MNKKTKKLPEERYDEKLFKQAMKAAKEAKLLEERIKKRKKIKKGILFTLIPIIVFPLLFFLISLLPNRNEYIEAGEYSKESTFESFTYENIEYELPSEILVTDITAKSAISFNPRNGDILYEKDAFEKRSIASLTKILSAIVVIENYDLEEVIEVSLENIPEDLDWQLEIEEGDRVSVRTLLKSMLMSSFNDTAYIVANAYPYGGYDGFIKAMNSKAKVLKMKDSKFSNPAGLDEQENYSTAMDVAILISVARNYKEIQDTVALGKETVNWSSNGTVKSKVIYTTNQLYGINAYSKGFKTGITKLAGQCFAGYFVYPNGKELITVVLDSEDRFKDTTILEKVSREVLK